jgi:anti-sigma regulatory factor (Ser/Thr protein kinase)
MILRAPESSGIAAARRAVCEFARRIGLDEERSGRAALLVTGMATNLVKHAGGGGIALERFADGAGESEADWTIDPARITVLGGIAS